MNYDDLLEIVKTRRSIRKWKSDAVSKETILKAIELGTWAPNGGNRQPYKFYVVMQKELIVKMADAVQHKAEKLAAWPEAGEFFDTTSRWKANASFFRNAPVCIAVTAADYQSLADTIMQKRAANSGDSEAEEMIEARKTGNSKIQSVASTIAYLLLALHAEGLGACWMTGPLQAKSEIEAMLDIPADLDLVALIPVGYPAEDPPLKHRKPVEEVVTFI